MKTNYLKTGYLKSIISLCILAAFIYIAYGYLGGISQQKRQLPDGRWEIAKHYSGGNTEIMVGDVDEYGIFHGPVKITYEDDTYTTTHTEEVNMVHGVRNGISKVTYPNGAVRNTCYEDGESVAAENCQKSAKIGDESTAYELFSYQYPWYEFKLDAMGFDSIYIKSFLDTFETVLYANTFDPADFEDYYDETVSTLEETHFDSIIVLNDELTTYIGLDLILLNEFRLATLESYIRSDSNTFNTVNTIYPNYLLYLNQSGIEDLDFEEFCVEYDSMMSSYPPIALTDTFIIDTIDSRMYRTVTYIASEEEGSSAQAMIKSAGIPSGNISPPVRNYISLAKQYLETAAPSDVATIIFYSFLFEFQRGDMIHKAVTDAYALKKGIVTLPTVTSKLVSASETKVVIGGNVINNGGGEITERGIAWATFYNPAIEDGYVASGNGTGAFEVNFDALETGVTYYFRAYAKNSAGVSYGSCLSLTHGSTGLDELVDGDYNFNVYPNPAVDIATVEFRLEKRGNVDISLYDFQGRLLYRYNPKILRSGVHQHQINLSSFENGIYNCRIISESEMGVKKILVSK